MNEASAKDRRCPLCSEENRCRIANGCLYRGACWCEEAAIPAHVLRYLAQQQPEPACLCRRCLSILARYAKTLDDPTEIIARVREEIIARVREEIIARVREEIIARVREEIIARVREEIIARVREEIIARVREEIIARVREEIIARVREEIIARVREEIIARVREEIIARVREEIIARVREEISPVTSVEDFYLDEHGRTVFTAAYHLKRGSCCGNGCRHCPYPLSEKETLPAHQ